MKIAEKAMQNKEAAKLLKQDIAMLQGKLKKVIENANFPGSSYNNMALAMEHINGTLAKPPKKIDDSYLQELVKALARTAHFSKALIEDSLIPGDMIEEAYEAKVMCQHVEDRWIKNG